MSTRIAIVGAGITGLTQALKLHEQVSGQNYSISVFDSNNRPGGAAWSNRIDGYLAELGPNGFLDNRLEIMDLAKQVGLESQLVRVAPEAKNRFIWNGRRLVPVPLSIVRFLRTSLLTTIGKARFISERFRAANSPQDESIHAFATRRFGRQTADNLIDPFVTGIYAGDCTKLSLPACFPTLQQWERDNGSILKTVFSSKLQSRSAGPGKLVAPAGGMRQLMEALATCLGDRLKLNMSFERLERTAHGYRLLDQQGAAVEADVLIFACPADMQAKFIAAIDPQLAAELNAIPSSPVAVVSLGFRREDLPANVHAFGYLTPQRLGRPVLGVIFTSAIFPNQAPDGYFQFRAILGGWQRPEVVTWNDAQLVEAVRKDLRESLGLTASPTFEWTHRWPKGIPQYHVGHLERLARIDDRLRNYPGLFLTGNSFRGVSLNDCVKDANRTVEQVKAYLENRATR